MIDWGITIIFWYGLSFEENNVLGVDLPPFSAQDDSELTESGSYLFSDSATEDTFTAEFNVVGEGKMLPGTYTVLASNEENTKFNLRIGGVVREYTHGQKIVLSKGETITAVSHIVILR